MRKSDSKRDLGQTLVEMALVFPIIILMVMGIFDLGRAVWQAGTVAEAAREGARYAATSPADCTGIVNTATKAAIGVKLASSSPIVISEPSTPPAQLGAPVTVTVRATFSPVTPLIAKFTGSSITITRASTMIIENGNSNHC